MGSSSSKQARADTYPTDKLRARSQGPNKLDLEKTFSGLTLTESEDGDVSSSPEFDIAAASKWEDKLLADPKVGTKLRSYPVLHAWC
jgi:hypothetical protein